MSDDPKISKLGGVASEENMIKEINARRLEIITKMEDLREKSMEQGVIINLMRAQEVNSPEMRNLARLTDLGPAIQQSEEIIKDLKGLADLVRSTQKSNNTRPMGKQTAEHDQWACEDEHAGDDIPRSASIQEKDAETELELECTEFAVSAATKEADSQLQLQLAKQEISRLSKENEHLFRLTKYQGSFRVRLHSSSSSRSDSGFSSGLSESSSDGAEYSKQKGIAVTVGQDYEIKMSALLFVRGLNNESDFELATNVNGGGALSDIVYKFTTPDDVCHTAFIQIKHKKTGKIIRDSLVTRGGFSLTKYFEAFMNIKHQINGDGTGFFSGSFETCNFALFTNADLVSWKRNLETRYWPSPVDDYIMLNEVEASFTEEVVETLYYDLKKEEEKQMKPLSYPISKNENDAREFLRRFRMYTGQPSEDQLDDVIKEELMKFGIKKEDLDAVYRLFLEKMKAWWQQSEGVILYQNSTILLEAHAEAMLPHVEKLTLQEKMKFKIYVKFLESSTADMKDACANQLSLVNVPSQQLFRMTASKVLQTLEPQRGKYIFLSLESLLKEREAVMSSWRHGKNDLLVLVCNATINEENKIVAELSQVLIDREDKRLILITDADGSFSKQLREKMSKFYILQDSFHISQLCLESVHYILQKEVVLQGTFTSLGAIIGDDLDLISNELEDILETIIVSDSLVVGDELKEGISFFIPRTMQFKRVIKNQIFSDKNYAGRIIIHGASLHDAADFIPSKEQTIRKEFQQSSQGLVFKASDEDKTKDANTRNDVHYLELIDGRLVWKKTYGDINFIKKYIDESDVQTVEDPEDRVVLLIDEPGMGKTTQLAHVAQQTKQQHPNCWVLPVVLNEHATVLAKTKKEELSAEAFLYSAVGIGKMSAVAQALFKFCFMHTSNMIVLLDGCDEIAPKYTDQCLALVQSLLRSKVMKVWIASRNSLKHILEYHLSILHTSLRKFNIDDQRGYLEKYWRKIGDVTLSSHQLDSFITRVLEMTAQSINDKKNNLMGIPLQTRMLAEVFQEFVFGKYTNLPNKLNALELIEAFVEKKFITHCAKTMKLDESNPYFELIVDEVRTNFYENHYGAALLLLFGERECQSLNSFDLKTCSTFMANITRGTDKTGIIDIIVDNKPVFINRVFAEFFVAHWLSEHFHNNSEFMTKHLLGEKFCDVRHMFDRILARGIELHEAVLNADVQRVGDMLGGGSDLNSTDRGGRTALHLAVLAALNNPSEDKSSIPIIQLLMDHKARVDLKDYVFQWTPIEYADATKLWAEMDILLAYASIDKSQFRTTKQNIHDGHVGKYS